MLKSKIAKIITYKKTKDEIDDIKTRQLIYKTLKKYYINYNENIWKKILTEKEWEKYFRENWLDKNKKPEHGGYINPQEMKEIMGDDSVLPKELPSLKSKNNTSKITIPTCAYNLKKYQRNYINILRKYLLNLMVKY